MIERNWEIPLGLELVEPESLYTPDQLELPDAPLIFAHFGGIQSVEEHQRLKVILYRVKRLMSDGKWRTHEEMSQLCGCKPTTAASKLRDLKTLGFGNHKVDRDPDPERPHCYIYRLTLNPDDEDAKRWAKEAENAQRRFYKAKHPNLFDLAI